MGASKSKPFVESARTVLSKRVSPNEVKNVQKIGEQTVSDASKIPAGFAPNIHLHYKPVSRSPSTSGRNSDLEMNKDILNKGMLISILKVFLLIIIILKF